jgi:hypothetical protein
MKLPGMVEAPLVTDMLGSVFAGHDLNATGGVTMTGCATGVGPTGGSIGLGPSSKGPRESWMEGQFQTYFDRR